MYCMKTTKLITAALLAMLTMMACHKDDNPVAVSGITLDKPTLELTVGETGRLTVTVTPEDAADKNVVWKSGNTAAATVGADGLVTAVAAGNATITATAGGKSATCSVTVKDRQQPDPGVDTDSGIGDWGSQGDVREEISTD